MEEGYELFLDGISGKIAEITFYKRQNSCHKYDASPLCL